MQVSYTPDVFGGTRRNVESLQAQADNQRFQLEATYLTLTSNIVVAAVQEASLRGQIAVTYKLIKIATDLLHTLREQLSAGVISEVDISHAGSHAGANRADIAAAATAIGAAAPPAFSAHGRPSEPGAAREIRT